VTPAADLLARFDAEIRRDPPPEIGFTYDRSGDIIRALGPYCWIVWWNVGAAECDAAVAAEAHAFRAAGRSVEWKVYGHDSPSNLELALARNGFAPDAYETLMIADPARVAAAAPGNLTADITVQRVTDERRLDDLVAVTSQAFGRDAGWMRTALPPQLFATDPRASAYVAYIGTQPAACGRLEFPAQRSIASLWGGATVEAFRGRGLFRAVVAARAAFARDAGYSLLTVEARAASRPILERLGFRPLTSVRCWNLELRKGNTPSAGDAAASFAATESEEA
jgi:GNAT superfamily N-acetyltransferase